jgi:hypothetical protein
MRSGLVDPEMRAVDEILSAAASLKERCVLDDGLPPKGET